MLVRLLADLLASRDVTSTPGTDPTGAGFVQVMRATVADRARLEAGEEAIGPAFRALRPDFLAGYRVWLAADGSRLVAVDFFTSEADARAGEAQEMPDDLRRLFGEWMSLLADVEWYDLTQPWLSGPSGHAPPPGS